VLRSVQVLVAVMLWEFESPRPHRFSMVAGSCFRPLELWTADSGARGKPSRTVEG
jgi:hypothetical protein